MYNRIEGYEVQQKGSTDDMKIEREKRTQEHKKKVFPKY